MSYTAKSKNLHKPMKHVFSFPFYYTQDGTLIQSVSSVRDLGMEMESSAGFDKQVSLSIRKWIQFAGWALKVFRNRDNLSCQLS